MEEDLEREIARNEAATRMAREREDQAMAARKRYALQCDAIRWEQFLWRCVVLDSFNLQLHNILEKKHQK